MIAIEKGKPFQLPDGTVINPTEDPKDDGRIVRVAEQIADEKLDEVTADPISTEDLLPKRSLADLPANAERTNITMLVLAYTIWGLTREAIAILLGTDAQSIQAVKDTDTYHTLRQEMLEAIRYAETGSIHGLLAQHARVAAKRVISAISSKSEDAALIASKDILDRAGFRPTDRTEHIHKFEDELRIVMVSEEKLPTIDLKRIHNAS